MNNETTRCPFCYGNLIDGKEHGFNKCVISMESFKNTDLKLTETLLRLRKLEGQVNQAEQSEYEKGQLGERALWQRVITELTREKYTAEHQNDKLLEFANIVKEFSDNALHLMPLVAQALLSDLGLLDATKEGKE